MMRMEDNGRPGQSRRAGAGTALRLFRPSMIWSLASSPWF